MRTSRKAQLVRDLVITAMRFDVSVAIRRDLSTNPDAGLSPAPELCGTIDVLDGNTITLRTPAGSTFVDVYAIDYIGFHTASGPGSDAHGERPHVERIPTAVEVQAQPYLAHRRRTGLEGTA